jgi:TonB family protein
MRCQIRFRGVLSAILFSVVLCAPRAVQAQDAQAGQQAPTTNGAQSSDAPSTPLQHGPLNVSAAKLVKMVPPTYPRSAKKDGICGIVKLHATIAKDGTIRHVEYVSGPAELAKPALDAVKRWRYTPTRLNGEPVEVNTTVSVHFTLDGCTPREDDEARPGSADSH